MKIIKSDLGSFVKKSEVQLVVKNRYFKTEKQAKVEKFVKARETVGSR